MENDINKIISNSLLVNKEKLINNIDLLVQRIKDSINENKNSIEEANKIDIKNNNGFIIDTKVFNNIFTNLEKENLFYGTITQSQKNDDDKFVYGKEIMDKGNVIVISDGNTYTLLEMAIRNIMAGNTTIFSNDGYMFGTNDLLIKIIQDVLEEFDISRDLIQLFISEEFDDILSNFANIDLVICIGDHKLQSLVLDKSKNETIISGYDNYDLYVEDDSYIDFLNKIMNNGLNIQLFINSDTKLDYNDAIIVNDIDEAIAQINYNGSRYSATIFTKSSKNASRFIKEVKAKQVSINTSPSIERLLDITQNDLVNEKTIIYPINSDMNNQISIELKDD